MVCVRNGSIDRLSEVKFGERGSAILERDDSVGGCVFWISEEGTGLGSEWRKEVSRCELCIWRGSSSKMSW